MMITDLIKYNTFCFQIFWLRDGGLPKKPICKHNSKSLKCMQLANQDLFYFHKRLYENISKIEQDNYILKHITVKKVKRFRPRKGSKNPRAFNVKFYIPKY